MNRVKTFKIFSLVSLITILISCATRKPQHNDNISLKKAQMLRDSAYKYAYEELDIKRSTLYYDSLFTSNYVMNKDYYDGGQVAAEAGNYAKCISLWTTLLKAKNDDEYNYVYILPNQVGAQDYHDRLINAKGFARFWHHYYPNFPLDPRLSPQDSVLSKKINRMFTEDQAVRHNYMDHPTKQNDSLYMHCDAKNTKTMDSIIASRGIISSKEFGFRTGKDFAILFAHLPDSSVKKYMPLMEKTIKHKGVNNTYYALIKDKWLIYNKKEQLYGTQFHMDATTKKTIFFPIKHIGKVDKKRKEMGLGTLKYYAEHYKVLLPEGYRSK